MNTFSTDEALKIAFAVYRVNGGYIKETQYNNEGEVTRWGNKDTVKFMAALEAISEGSKSHWVPEGFEPIKVTEDDLTALESARKHFKRYTFLIIGDDLNQFQKDTFAAFSSEECTVKNVGFIAYIPAMIEREVHDIAYRRRLKNEFADSEIVLDKTVAGEVEILKSLYLKEHSIYLYIAGVGKNLVVFTKDKKYEIGSKYSINAKVKGHDVERETRLPMTKLNYVKLSYIEE